MNRRTPFLATLAAALCALLGAPRASAAVDATPQKVTVGLYITDVPELSIKDGYFGVDMYLWMRHSGATDLETFEIPSGQIEMKEESERKEVPGGTYVCWRVKAKVRSDFPLRDYPFDRQRLSIRIEHPSLETDALVYEPDEESYKRSKAPRERWGLKSTVEIPEYRIRGTSWHAEQSTYETDFGDPTRQQTESHYSRLVFDIDVSRNYLPYCYKTLIPLIVIIAMAYLVFFLPPNEIQTASGLSMTALLSCVALNLSLASNLPDIGYLVASDKFFITTYVLIFVALAETVGTYGLAHEGQVARAEKIERYFRWSFPPAFLAAFGWLALRAISTRI